MRIQQTLSTKRARGLEKVFVVFSKKYLLII